MECTLKIAVPEAYREWALQILPPFWEGEAEKDIPFSALFCGDADHLIKRNLLLRENKLTYKPWPHHFFCIGDFQGNNIFINLREPDKVYYDQSENGQYDPENLSYLVVTLWDDFIEEVDS